MRMVIPRSQKLLRQHTWSPKDATNCLGFLVQTLPLLKLLQELDTLGDYHLDLEEYGSLPLAYQNEIIRLIQLPLHDVSDAQPEEDDDESEHNQPIYYAHYCLPIDASEFEIEEQIHYSSAEVSPSFLFAQRLTGRKTPHKFPSPWSDISLWHLSRAKWSDEDFARLSPALSPLRTAYQILSHTTGNPWFDKYTHYECDIEWEINSIRAAEKTYLEAQAIKKQVEEFDTRLATDKALQQTFIAEVNQCLK